ncbi:MAG: RNA ligase family protein [Methylococcaceae bacterium]|nr:RNA ligase family protein [Methylococcaceae bacterium]
MSNFFRFPHTPHIVWLGDGLPRDDKVLAPDEVEELLSDKVLVEKKLDGANLGISVGPDGKLRAQNRGQYLLDPFMGQFSRLTAWLRQHEWRLREQLDAGLILFGEWCAARHSLSYESLPDWFVVFDVYDRNQQQFWSSARRNVLAASLGLAVVPALYQGKIKLNELTILHDNSTSRYRAGPPEGLVIRKQSADWCEARTKLVRAEFTQTIGEHSRSRAIQWNRVRTQAEAQ